MLATLVDMTMPRQKEPAGNSRHRRRANPVSDCPLTAALAAIGGKWKLIIIYWLNEGPLHFAGLRRKMSGISQKVLTKQLRELEADEIVARKAAERIPQVAVGEQIVRHGRQEVVGVEVGDGLGAVPAGISAESRHDRS